MTNEKKLQNDVMDELAWDPAIDATRIGVTVNDDIVTLTGTVKSYHEKYMAEKAVKRVNGVRGVANDLKVYLPRTMARTDTDIAKVALNALDWSVNVPSDEITVTVKDAWITLEGDVGWNFQKEAAERTVRSLAGVKGVTNLIRIRPHVTPENIKARIGDALRRTASLDAQHLRVEVEAGKVTLTGAVRSWPERKDAENAAWAAPGVFEVINNVTIEPEVLVS
jgi:osmotically-inducible protein OsmY